MPRIIQLESEVYPRAGPWEGCQLHTATVLVGCLYINVLKVWRVFVMVQRAGGRVNTIQTITILS